MFGPFVGQTQAVPRDQAEVAFFVSLGKIDYEAFEDWWTNLRPAVMCEGEHHLIAGATVRHITEMPA